MFLNTGPWIVHFENNYSIKPLNALPLQGLQHHRAYWPWKQNYTSSVIRRLTISCVGKSTSFKTSIMFFGRAVRKTSTLSFPTTEIYLYQRFHSMILKLETTTVWETVSVIRQSSQSPTRCHDRFSYGFWLLNFWCILLQIPAVYLWRPTCQIHRKLLVAACISVRGYKPCSARKNTNETHWRPHNSMLSSPLTPWIVSERFPKNHNWSTSAESRWQKLIIPFQPRT